MNFRRGPPAKPIPPSAGLPGRDPESEPGPANALPGVSGRTRVRLLTEELAGAVVSCEFVPVPVELKVEAVFRYDFESRQARDLARLTRKPWSRGRTYHCTR